MYIQYNVYNTMAFREIHSCSGPADFMKKISEMNPLNVQLFVINSNVHSKDFNLLLSLSNFMECIPSNFKILSVYHFLYVNATQTCWLTQKSNQLKK